MEHGSEQTTDHNIIRKWVEDRNGKPAAVKGTEHDDSALLRIDFGEPEESLKEISWDDFFRIFDENNLAFLYQEHTADGSVSRFFKFVSNE